MEKLTIAQAKQIDLADYLAALGHYPDPKKSNHRDYWYLSPLPGRNEKTPSFKVDRKRQLWYDHGIGKGGSIIDFGMQYFGCTIPELLDRLQDFVSFHRPALTGQQPGNWSREPGHESRSSREDEEKKIRVLADGPITSPALIYYLHQRRIPLALVQPYCREVSYELYGRQYYAIGFQSDAGGYELRNPYFKGSSSPKGSRFIDNSAERLYVFEGFFNFLSFLVLQQYRPQPSGNYLVLNSLSFFERSRPLMERHATICLYLDRDKAGMKVTAEAVKDDARYIDGSMLYREYNDLNQWLTRNCLQLRREAQAPERAKEAADEIQKMQVARNRQRGRHL